MPDRPTDRCDNRCPRPAVVWTREGKVCRQCAPSEAERQCGRLVGRGYTKGGDGE